MSVVKLGYKHLETDVEFRTRAAPMIVDRWVRIGLENFSGEQLDIYVWDVLKRQRQIIEVFP